MKAPIKPNISSLKETKFSDSVKSLKHKPNSKILKAIDSNLFSLSGNRVFRYKTDVLAVDEYKRCLSLVEKRTPSAYNASTTQAIQILTSILPSVTSRIMVKELKHIKELEKIAEETIREIFDVPNHISILPCITGGLMDIDEQDDSPDSVLSLTSERQREIREEIEKRIILNSLVHGCAMHIWKSAHYIIKDKIDGLDPALMELYNFYISTVGWIFWQVSPGVAMANIDEVGLAQGINELKFEQSVDSECDIHCSAINFPVLLHEVAKGAMDYLICRGIPADLTEEELRYYYAKSDNYANEYWHYLISPSIWNSLIKSANTTTQTLPYIIAQLSQLKYHDLSSVIKACIDGEESGNKKLKEFKIL